jgi:hypothetical protein
VGRARKFPAKRVTRQLSKITVKNEDDLIVVGIFAQTVEVETELTRAQAHNLAALLQEAIAHIPMPLCSVCGKPWQWHYDPDKLQYKNGPYGTFGLTAEHTPHLGGLKWHGSPPTCS